MVHRCPNATTPIGRGCQSNRIRLRSEHAWDRLPQHRVTDPTPTRPQYTLYFEGDELYAAMLDAINGATRCVRLESYIFANDEVGNAFIDALVGAARRGANVRLHVDAVGSLFALDAGMQRRLDHPKIAWRWFHPLQLHKLGDYNRRNHRKLLTVDARLAFLGGFNIHRASSRRWQGPTRWRDTHIGIEGPLAHHAEALFDFLWKTPPKGPACLYGAGPWQLLSNHTPEHRDLMTALLGGKIDQARDRVLVTNPYFVPGRAGRQLLAAAARRGAAVWLLLPYKNDFPLTHWASQAAYSELLAAGVRVFEYQPRLLHAKTLVVDDWSTLGSANFDHRSLRYNYELNLVAEDRQLADALAAQFWVDLEDAEEVLQHPWKRRPWSGHLNEFIGWIARRWL